VTSPLDQSRDLDTQALKANRERDAEEQRIRDQEFRDRDQDKNGE
jgi:hypothetical protein